MIKMIDDDKDDDNREAAELARNAATEEAKANALTGGKVEFIPALTKTNTDAKTNT